MSTWLIINLYFAVCVTAHRVKKDAPAVKKTSTVSAIPHIANIEFNANTHTQVS
jgi:hypothetical protein